MANPLLELVSYSQDREILPVRGHGLAIGRMTSRFFLKAQSGTIWAVDVPNEMFDDVAISHAESLHPGFDVGDDVVPPRHEDSASAEQG